MITFPYQRGKSYPQEGIIGYGREHYPQLLFDEKVAAGAEIEFNKADNGFNATFCIDIEAGDQNRWDVLDYLFSGDLTNTVGRRYFSFLDDNGDPFQSETGTSIFYTNGIGTDNSPTSIRLYFLPGLTINDVWMANVATIKFRKPSMVLRNLVPTSSLLIDFQSIFADGGLLNNLNDGYGWPYVLLPKKGNVRFPEYNYWSTAVTSTSRDLLYAPDSVPDLPMNTPVYIKDSVTYQGNEYWYITQRGWDNGIIPAHLSSIYLHTTL